MQRGTPTKWAKIRNNIWRNRYIYMMVLPILIYLALFKYMPMWFLKTSFYDYKLLKGFDGSKYVGLKWFKRLFSNPNLMRYIGNTLRLNLSAMVFLFPLPMIFAIFLNELRSVRYKKTVQTISYLPHFVSTVVMVSMITTITSPSLGIIGKIISASGGVPKNYLADPNYFVPINVISGAWQSIGWDAVIYVSALASIDQGLYEAAKIDGANRFKQVLHVTLPGLLPTFIIILIMRMGQMLNVNFEKVYLLQNNLNLPASEMLPTFSYKTGMESRNYGYATAVGLFNSVISLFLVLIANQISKRTSEISLM
ncbi:MAG: ABC transporter permease subunit [Eubacteriales bacterium]|nr:ABC transporter permease subunit [Eubacteriales bacterium]